MRHADETPVAMLKPGHGKAHPAYLSRCAAAQLYALRGVACDFDWLRVRRPGTAGGLSLP